MEPFIRLTKQWQQANDRLWSEPQGEPMSPLAPQGKCHLGHLLQSSQEDFDQ